MSIDSMVKMTCSAALGVRVVKKARVTEAKAQLSALMARAGYGGGSNDFRPDGWTSADAAGLPIFAGLIRRDEVEAGEIDHAIRVTADQTDKSYLWPARHQAGARFRLKAGFDISGFRPDTRVIL